MTSDGQPAFLALIHRIRRVGLIRFLAVGALNTVFGYGCFAGLLYAGLHYAIASLLSTVLGVLFNFISIGNLVFKPAHISRLLPFFGVYLIQYLINLGLLKLMVTWSINLYIGAACTLLPMALLSYTLNKRFVFHGSQAD